MSWSEIKKAVNSDLSTPLNTLITNARNHIETAGNIKSVKSVQRGTVSFPTSGASSRTITISEVDISKSIVIGSGGFTAVGTSSYATASFKLTDSTTVTVECSYAVKGTSFSCQVIEFY